VHPGSPGLSRSAATIQTLEGVVDVVVPVLHRGPVALGYLSVARPDSTENAFWSWAIAGFCIAGGRALRHVFRDTGVNEIGTLNRVGWTMLLAELAGLRAPAVIVPGMQHLGDPEAQARMCAQVAAAGGIVHPLTPAGLPAPRIGGR
jgi:hypothetical protein